MFFIKKCNKKYVEYNFNVVKTLVPEGLWLFIGFRAGLLGKVQGDQINNKTHLLESKN